MLIAEVGLNHLGSISSANVLLDAAIFSEADAVTFQVREKSFYEKEKFANMQLSLELYKDLCKEVHKYKKKFGIALSDLTMLDKFEAMNVDFYKILSKDLKNDNFLKLLGSKTKKDLYLSTGLASTSAISKALKILKNNNVTLIHTRLSNKVEDANLKAINTMKENFKNNIAYGHHCDNLNVLIAAQTFEPSDVFFYIRGNKPVTYPDHDHAIPTDVLKYYITNIKIIEKALGDGVKLEGKNKIKGQI